MKLRQIMKAKFRIPLGIGLLLLGAFVFWYLFAGYFESHLFRNKYGSRSGEPLHWLDEPWPIMDPDGTSVLVDYSKNELAIVLKPPADSGLITWSNDTSGISVLVDNKWIAIPASPDRCVLVDGSGARIGRSLKPGEAKLLFEQFQKERPGNLRAAIPPDLLGLQNVASSNATRAAPSP